VERRYLSHSRTAEILRKTASLKSDNRLLLSGGQKRLSRWRPFAILNFRDPKNGIFEKRVQDFLLVVNNKLPSFFKRKPRFCVRVLGDRQTDRETSEQDYRVKPPRLNIHLGLDFLLARYISDSTDLLGLELNILILGSSLL